jgi:hypothetical protein
MVDLGAQGKAAGPKGSAVHEAYRCSVKVVAGECNQRYLHALVSRIPVVCCASVTVQKVRALHKTVDISMAYTNPR